MAAQKQSSAPSPAVLGLSGERAAADLKTLGWTRPEDAGCLWAMAGSGSPDLALNTVIRLYERLSDVPGEVARLDETLHRDASFRLRFMALAGGSSALGDLLVARPERWEELLAPPPTRAEMFRTLLGAVGARPVGVPGDTARVDCTSAGTYRAAPGSLEDAQRLLSTEYRALIARVAADDLAGTFPATRRHPGGTPVPFTTVTARLSDLADAALTAALAVSLRAVWGEEQPDGQLAVVALGKCGARELNYISDVDVVFVADEITPRVTRAAGEFMRIATQCFFEVDANLRPEGRSGALVRTLDSYRSYYRRWAETWEFQALLKARPQTGCMALGERFRELVDPMVWRAAERDSFVADVQGMRRRVLEHVSAEKKSRELKLGEGGLRDVEFAVQLLQLVHGRSDETLRERATVPALAALVDAGVVGREDGHELIASYEFLRLLEHRLQLQRLRRTHLLPRLDDEAALTWLARASGLQGGGGTSVAGQLCKALRRVRREIAELHASLFYRPLLDSVAALPVATLRLSPEAAKRQLNAVGYRYPDRAWEHLSALARGTTRKSKIQAMLLPTLMDWLGRTADPDGGLLNYRKLSDAVYDRSWFLRLLRDEGVVGQRLMHILGTSPYAAGLIIASPDVVKTLGDGTGGPRFLGKAPETVSRSLLAGAARHDDPDRAIAVARSLRRLELARIAAADLLGFMDVREVCRGLSLVWDAVLEAALRAEIRHSLATGGLDEAPGRIAIIGMGRLGGAELGYGSDADVLFVCEPAPGTDPDAAIRWATGVCDGVRTRLARPSGDPPLEVDLGLRPEGRSGAVVRTVSSYQAYYRRWGEAWEFQALLRATRVAGDKEVARRFLEAIDEFRYPPGGASTARLREIRRMKARVDEERLPRGADRNTHTKLGRGALTDIEWTVQLLIMQHAHRIPALHTTSTLEALDALAALDDPEILPAADVVTLKDAWLCATNARNALVLVRGKRTDQLPQTGRTLVQVAAAAGWRPDKYQDFLENYLRTTRRARRVVDTVFWGETTMES